ncbi:hypothetical protein HDV05_001173 [Chytridiales sp. JEL 0842]|nr:hypothetical protein HDV05_001173 [Chytridiales sp. JEL 0842]
MVHLKRVSHLLSALVVAIVLLSQTVVTSPVDDTSSHLERRQVSPVPPPASATGAPIVPTAISTATPIRVTTATGLTVPGVTSSSRAVVPASSSSTAPAAAQTTTNTSGAPSTPNTNTNNGNTNNNNANAGATDNNGTPNQAPASRPTYLPTSAASPGGWSWPADAPPVAFPYGTSGEAIFRAGVAPTYPVRAYTSHAFSSFMAMEGVEKKMVMAFVAVLVTTVISVW